MDRIELQARALAIAAELSAIRGEQWGVADRKALDEAGYMHAVVLTGPDDAVLWLTYETRPYQAGILRLSGGFSGTPLRHLDYHRHRPFRPFSDPSPATDINVSASKSATVVAKDINRRLLPDYLAELAAARKSSRESADYEAGKVALEAELARIVGSLSYLGIPGHSYGSVQVNGPDRVDIHLRSLPAAQARQVLALVLAWRASETETAAGEEVK